MRKNQCVMRDNPWLAAQRRSLYLHAVAEAMEHGWILTKHGNSGWVYNCFFCKYALIFTDTCTDGMTYFANNATVVGWHKGTRPSPKTPAELQIACTKRTAEDEREYEIAAVMSL